MWPWANHLNHPVPQPLRLLREANYSSHLRGLLRGLSELIQARLLEQCPAPCFCSTNVTYYFYQCWCYHRDYWETLAVSLLQQLHPPKLQSTTSPRTPAPPIKPSSSTISEEILPLSLIPYTYASNLALTPQAFVLSVHLSPPWTIDSLRPETVGFEIIFFLLLWLSLFLYSVSLRPTI